MPMQALSFWKSGRGSAYILIIEYHNFLASRQSSINAELLKFLNAALTFKIKIYKYQDTAAIEEAVKITLSKYIPPLYLKELLYWVPKTGRAFFEVWERSEMGAEFPFIPCSFDKDNLEYTARVSSRRGPLPGTFKVLRPLLHRYNIYRILRPIKVERLVVKWDEVLRNEYCNETKRLKVAGQEIIIAPDTLLRPETEDTIVTGRLRELYIF